MTRHDTHIRLDAEVWRRIGEEATIEQRPHLNNMIEVLLMEALTQREKKRKRRKRVTQESGCL